MEEQLSAKSRLERCLRTRLSSKQQRNKYITATFCQAKVNDWGPSDSYQKADCFTIKKEVFWVVPRILLMLLEILFCQVMVAVKGAAKGGNCVFEIF